MDGKPALKAEGATWVVIVATAAEPASPLQRALHQAAKLAPRERICVVAAAEQRERWRRPLWFLPASNVVVQPEGADIEQGVSETIQKIVRRDGAAKVVLLSASGAHPARYGQQHRAAPAEFPLYPAH